MKKNYLLLAILSTSLLLASCNGNKGEVTKGSYTLTLNALGGTFSDKTSTKTYTNVGSVTAASAIEQPSRAATSSYTYTFNGWYDSNTESANKITFPYTLTKNTTFYAAWSATAVKTVTVTLDANGGKFSNNQSTYTLSNVSKITKSTISSLTPTKDNSEFLGWYYTTTAYNDEVSFPYTPTSDTTLHAMWGTGDGYTITLDPCGGTFTDSTTENKTLTNQYKVNYSSLDVPSKQNGDGQNYIFIGWGLSSTTSEIKSGSEILQNNLNLYAIYKEPGSDAFGLYTADGGTYTKENNKYTLKTAGTYTLVGNLTEGQIYVDAGDDDVVNIDLKDCSITSNKNIPFYVNNADSVKIKAYTGTSNYIYDNRTINEDETDGGAIYCDADLKLVGKGSLHIDSTANNGIHGEKDVDIKNLSLYVRGQNNGIRGEHSITIESGNIQVIGISNDGLKTTDNGLTSKQKQKGDIKITGGTVDIDSYGDAITAAHDVVIESGVDDDGNVTTPSIDIKTYKYAETGGTPISTDTLYIRSTTDFRSTTGGNVIVSSYNSGGTANNVTATYKGTETIQSGGWGPGGQTTYYVWTLPRPQNYQNLKIYVGASTSSYTYSTDAKTYNSSYNMITLSKYSGSTLNFSWGVHTGTSAELSCKGIKSENAININTSSVNIKSFDNAIHANADSIIESTSAYGIGTINITNGDISIYTDDKGVHADNYLYVSGGAINVSTSYEGYEASNINISGGQSHIYATDDGLNAGSKDSTVTNKQINVSGGYVDVQVGSGDTDGIDSNGTFTVSGGVVISRASQSNQMSTALDTDGQSTISSSGVFIALGYQPEAERENRLSCSSKSGRKTDKAFNQNTTHTINNTYLFTVTTSYSSYYYYLGNSASAPTIN